MVANQLKPGRLLHPGGEPLADVIPAAVQAVEDGRKRGAVSPRAASVRNATVIRRAPHSRDSPVAAHQWSADKMAVEGQIRGIASTVGQRRNKTSPKQDYALGALESVASA